MEVKKSSLHKLALLGEYLGIDARSVISEIFNSPTLLKKLNKKTRQETVTVSLTPEQQDELRQIATAKNRPERDTLERLIKITFNTFKDNFTRIRHSDFLAAKASYSRSKNNMPDLTAAAAATLKAPAVQRPDPDPQPKKDKGKDLTDIIGSD